MKPVVNRRIRTGAAWTLALGMFASAALHGYWALGGTWFLETASGPELERLYRGFLERSPGVIGLTWALVAAMLFVAGIALGRIRFFGRRVPQRIYSFVLWGVTACMVGGAVLNFSTRGFWEQVVFAPIFLILAVLSLILALPQDNRQPASLR